MNNYSFHATLTVSIFLNDEDFNFIFENCKNHYDTRIKYFTQIGGFLNGFKNRRTHITGLEITDDDRYVEFSFRQLDSMIKSLEMNSCETSSKLNLLFNKVISELTEKQKNINNNL